MRMKNRIGSLLLLALVTCLIMACSMSDAAITAKIKASMAADPSVNFSQIEVKTEKKVVTLTGNINSEGEKQRALDIARSTSGVVNVVDMIEVRTGTETGNAPEPARSLGEHIDDATITAAVKTRLLDDPLVKGLKIDVDTREGVVFLTGSVGSQKESERAVEIARATEHVKEVRPNLVIGKG
jgi:hyperosmotically inducible periplasmic protein